MGLIRCSYAIIGPFDDFPRCFYISIEHLHVNIAPRCDKWYELVFFFGRIFLKNILEKFIDLKFFFASFWKNKIKSPYLDLGNS